jgi:predicted transporter
VVTVLWLVSARAGRTFRCTGLASAGAICFGFGTTLLRSLAQPASTDLHTLLTPVAITSGVIMIIAMIVGGWAIQQAYNHGRAELVISTLTVGDPLVAVLLGIGLLGEGAGLSLWTAAFMIVCALIAATGVALLAKYHPEMAVDHDKTHTRSAPALSRTP